MTEPNKLSKCHNAPVTIEGVGDFIDGDKVVTMHYQCTECGEACDVDYYAADGVGRKPLSEPTNLSGASPNTPQTQTLEEILASFCDYCEGKGYTETGGMAMEDDLVEKVPCDEPMHDPELLTAINQLMIPRTEHEARVKDLEEDMDKLVKKLVAVTLKETS